MNKEVDSYYSSLTDIERFILSIDTAVEFFEEIGVDPKEATSLHKKIFDSCQEVYLKEYIRKYIV
ncbi:hypothetical protein [Fusobacterium ulcerans]|jgi:N-acetylglutamate synthase-like GNAT family acetyltransferase|uniref:Uncharacterized protein n=1 Tax=Fusobacterium ulcerans 12-1B TaxID=457404 RepID=H1PYQ1_9FUSO|nr:hypothetical protein [Fusobacterium ulcerans]EHO77240.1 hypothetical protein HMPREF0402_03544 [Fusobacterium ulcerans 12-1B]